MQLPFAKLTKAVVIFVTAICGNVNAAAPNPVLDDTVQLNPSDSSVAVKSDRRAGERARRVIVASRSGRQEWIDGRRPTGIPADDDRSFPSPSDPYIMPRTLFGVGSVALSALGNGGALPPMGI
jgi:hypothetical protein